MIIKQGSRWLSSQHQQFIVLADEVTLADGIWIHYREDNNQDNPREFSCFKDSFLSRFTPDANKN